MWWMAIAKAINQTQDAMRNQDMRRKQVAYNLDTNLNTDDESVQFGLNPMENANKIVLLAPKFEDDEDQSLS